MLTIAFWDIGNPPQFSARAGSRVSQDVGQDGRRKGANGGPHRSHPWRISLSSLCTSGETRSPSVRSQSRRATGLRHTPPTTATSARVNYTRLHGLRVGSDRVSLPAWATGVNACACSPIGKLGQAPRPGASPARRWPGRGPRGQGGRAFQRGAPGRDRFAGREGRAPGGRRGAARRRSR